MIGFNLGRVIGRSDPVRCLAGNTVRLLNHMGQLVGEKPFPFGSGRGIFPGSKYNIAPVGEGARLHRLGRGRRRAVGVHPHLAEIMAEARLHELADGAVEWPAGRAQNFVDERRGFGLTGSESRELSGGMSPRDFAL